MKNVLMSLGAICLLGMLAAGPVAAEPYFDSSVSYHVGSYPVAIASADFNGDLVADLVTANSMASSISVLLGNGNGTFATRVNYETGASDYPYNITTGDLDKNGTVDIVCGGNLGAVIFYGAGDGTFAAADVYYFGYTVHDVALADINNDTYLDLITSHVVLDSVGVHINDHDSTFTHHMLKTGQNTVSLAVGHLDADNYLDVLVGCQDGTVWNLKNNQAGSFIPTEVHLGIISDPAVIALADLNGDAFMDYGIIHTVNDFLYTYLNNGDGTYTIDRAYVVTDYPKSLNFVDVNHDNHVDILMCIQSTDEIELYLNQGNRSFVKDTSYTITGQPRDLTMADLDGDTYLDMAVVSYNTDAAAVLMSRLSLVLSVDDVSTDGTLPEAFTLEQNYPNPFNPETKIRFALPEASRVTIDVFNLMGQRVATLADEMVSAGLKEVTWNGTDGAGHPVSSGMYFYRLTTDQFTESKKMLLLK